METKGVWEEHWRIPSFMVDEQRKTNLVEIAHLLQELAGNHATFRKYGFYDVQKRGQFWILNRLIVEMNRFPIWQEEIRLQTWVSDIRGPFSHRNFQIIDTSHQILGTACTFWVLLDIEKKRPTKIEEHHFPILDNKIATCGYPKKLAPIKNAQTFQIHKVIPSDIDMIGHANNVKYLQWCLDYFKNANMTFSPHNMEVNFVGESFLKDKIFMCQKNTDSEIQLSLYKNRQEEVCRIRFY